MPKLFGLARIGRDVEVRTTANGEPVASLSLAFSYRAKGEKCTQWVDAALWGKRAEALAPYLIKGGMISVTLEDVHIETYQGAKGEGVTLVGRVMDIELAGGKQDGGGQTPQTAPQKPAIAAGGFDDLDSDVPF